MPPHTTNLTLSHEIEHDNYVNGVLSGFDPSYNPGSYYPTSGSAYNQAIIDVEDGEHTNAGAIAGGVVGGLAGLLALYLLYRWIKKRRANGGRLMPLSGFLLRLRGKKEVDVEKAPPQYTGGGRDPYASRS
ncbi:MAG: hypothetical protein Q9222_007166 [Ikaeria aurantiellina]